MRTLLVILASVFLGAIQASALELTIASPLNSEAIPAVKTFFAQSIGKLPPAYSKVLHDHSVKVRFVNNSARKMGDTNPFTHAIELNQSLLPAILSGVGADYDLAQATLLHELSHQYDYQTHISADPHFADLAGFPIQGFFAPHRKRANFLNERSVDPYERKNPKEAFAVNMEHFLLDPEYRCREPSLNRYLKDQLGWEPFPQSDCQHTNRVFVRGVGFKELDLKRLYEVDYLLAAPGKALESKWGHGMLRLVFCSPKRTTLGPECRKDLQEHLVISFRAAIDDFKQSRLDGLMGRYSSELFLMPMLDIIDEYTKEEFRDLISYPLKLSEDEKTAIFERTLEIHWAYAGKYYFLQNNCATETMNFLKAALPVSAHARFQQAFAARPTTIAKILRHEGLMENTGSNRDGLFFPSRLGFYGEQFEALRKLLPNDFSSFTALVEASASEREILVKNAAETKNKRAAAALYIFENMAQARIEKIIYNTAMKNYLESGAKETEVESLREGLKDTPASYLAADHQYGIPTEKEIAEAEAAVKAKLTDHQNLIPSLKQAIAAFIPAPLAAELAQCKANRAALYQAIIAN